MTECPAPKSPADAVRIFQLSVNIVARPIAPIEAQVSAHACSDIICAISV